MQVDVISQHFEQAGRLGPTRNGKIYQDLKYHLLLLLPGIIKGHLLGPRGQRNLGQISETAYPKNTTINVCY